jgi:ParB-like chromosome segregation protein Spo0J
VKIDPALEHLAVPIGDLVPHPENQRLSDVEAIAASLERFGQVRPIVVQASSGYVVAGNHLLATARELGAERVAAVRVDLDDEDATGSPTSAATTNAGSPGSSSA